MLGLFSNKSDHPLANFKSAQQLLDQLPQTDAIEVLQEVSAWIEALFDPAHPYPIKSINSNFAVAAPLNVRKSVCGARGVYALFGRLECTLVMKRIASAFTYSNNNKCMGILYVGNF